MAGQTHQPEKEREQRVRIMTRTPWIVLARKTWVAARHAPLILVLAMNMAAMPPKLQKETSSLVEWKRKAGRRLIRTRSQKLKL